ncbi:hypothetical protein C0J52_24767 [Blattella germanica]|nr:hypothetical protein C0J52_24767 [Blattella germanica]
MPPMKQVSSLCSLAIQSFLKQLNFAIRRIMFRMLPFTGYGEEVWLSELEKAKSEFTKINHYMSLMPHSVLIECETQVMKMANEVITDVLNTNSNTETILSRFELLCHFCLRSVIFPTQTSIQYPNTSTWDTRYALITNLDRLRNLTILNLEQGNFLPITSDIFVRSIKYLPKLQVFEYPLYSTDLVVQEIGQHCPEMRRLNVRKSANISHCSAEYLLKMRNLEYLDVSLTNISCVQYIDILKNLPKVKNIAWRGLCEYVLSMLDRSRLQIIYNIDADLNIMTVVRLRCPNITTLTLGGVVLQDVRSIARLRHLTSLSLYKLNFFTNALRFIFPELGPRLKKLVFDNIDKLDIRSVTQYCDNLESLIVQDCMFETSLGPDPETLHFNNLRSLSMISNTVNEYWYISCLHYYKNLEVFHCGLMSEFSHFNLESIVRQGGFSTVKELLIAFCGSMDKRTVYLLLEHCPSLCVLGSLRKWSELTSLDISEIKAFIKRQNYDVELSDSIPINWHILVDIIVDH